MRTTLFVSIVAIALIFGSNLAYVYSTDFSRLITVADTETQINSSDGVVSKLKLVSDTDGNVYQVSDTIWYGHWSSNDLYFKLKTLKGHQITIRGYGWRLPFFSTYPNIIGID